MKKITCGHDSKNHQWKTDSNGKKYVYCKLCKKKIYNEK